MRAFQDRNRDERGTAVWAVPYFSHWAYASLLRGDHSVCRHRSNVVDVSGVARVSCKNAPPLHRFPLYVHTMCRHSPGSNSRPKLPRPAGALPLCVRYEARLTSCACQAVYSISPLPPTPQSLAPSIQSQAQPQRVNFLLHFRVHLDFIGPGAGEALGGPFARGVHAHLGADSQQPGSPRGAS